MERILLVLDARNVDIASIRFGCKMASFVQTKLTGLFIENLYSNIRGREDAFDASVANSSHSVIVATNTEQSIKIFKEECLSQSVDADICVDTGEPIQQVIYESRFSDLLIIDPSMDFFNREGGMPSHFVKEVLQKAECPILLAPENFDEVDEIVFCYDGTASSVFAIKLFTYLLPVFANKRVLLLEVTDKNNELDEDHRRILKWLEAHYAVVNYHYLVGNVKEEMFVYFFMKKKKMIVMGAYGRSMVSNLFKKSKADVLIRMVDLPLFIAHY